MIAVSVILAALVGWVATFLLERTLRPRPRLVRRPAGAHAVHMGIWLTLFGVVLLAVRRPWLAMGLALMAWLLPVLVSNAKFASLKEPLVFTDLAFLSNALRHPRLYVPFFGAARAGLFLGALAGVAAGASHLLKMWPVPDDRPAFVFAITMENHGPLSLEPVSPGEAAIYFDPARDGGRPAPHDLTVYLRHLRNADRMVGTLGAWMASRPRQGFLCFYGDHVPIMPDVYDLGRAHDGSTDYVIWDSRRVAGGRKHDIPAERLGVMLLEAAGLMGATQDRPAGILRPSEYSC